MSNFQLIKDKIKVILRLALPMMTSSVAIALMGIADTIIVGHYNTNHLAYIGLANSIFVILFTIPIALLQGVVIKASQKFGARKFASTGKIWNEGKKYLMPLMVIFTIMGLCGPFILRILGQDELMVKESGRLLIILSFSIPFILLSVNDIFFLQSIKRPHIGMYGAIIANVINIMINPVMVYGWLGCPEMGAAGAAIATVTVRIFMAAFVRIYILRMKKNPKLNKRFGLDREYKTWWTDSVRTRKIGYGVAVTTVATNGSWAMANNFAGWMGPDLMATFVIINTVGGILFMLFFSLSQATSIIVANDYGRKDKNGMVISTLSGYVMLLSAVFILCSIIGLFPEQIFGLFTKDVLVISTAASLITLIILEIVIDTIPLNLVASLNGRSDVKVPTINQVISFLIIRLVFSYYLGVHLGWGIKGLLIGTMCGGVSSIILNGFRFLYLIKRDNLEGIR